MEHTEEFSIPEARLILADLFTPSVRRYAVDFIVSSAGGWLAFALALRFPFPSLPSIALLVPTLLLLFRTLSFIHPIYHLRNGSGRLMRALFDVMFGIPYLVPFFMYEASHGAHHHRAKFGTAQDAEYIRFSEHSRLRIALFLGLNIILPLLLALRFLVVGPLSFAHPRLRRFVVRKLSAFAVQSQYSRSEPRPDERIHWTREEIAVSLYLWSIVLLTSLGFIPLAFFLQWTFVGIGLALLNAFQFMALHRYEHEGTELEMQILDTLNTPGRWPWLTALWAPVGQRFHALHHIFPTLPYHNLPEAHRRLRHALPDDSIYHASENPSLKAALVSLWNRAGSRREVRGTHPAPPLVARGGRGV
jgi:fatty acid desaturase